MKFNVNHEVEGEVTPEEQTDMERVISILDSEIIKVNNKEQELNTLIDTIQTKLDNGEFNGKDGADGKDGQPGKDGKDGQNGINGQDGYTPQRGTDYWTSSDIAAIEQYCANYIDANINQAIGGDY